MKKAIGSFLSFLILSCFLTCFLACRGPALAQSNGGQEANDIAKAQADIVSLSQQIANEQAKTARLNAKLAALGNQFNAIKAQHDALQQQYARDAAAYNGNCAGKPVSYGNCPAWRAKVLGEQQQVTVTLTNMERQAAAMGPQGQEMTNSIVLANARVQKLANAKSQLEANLQTLKANLAKATAPAATGAPAAAGSTAVFGTTTNPANPDLGGAVPAAQPATAPSAQAVGAAKSGEAAKTAPSLEEAKGLSGCQFDTVGCKPSAPLTFVKSDPVSHDVDALAARIGGSGFKDTAVANAFGWYKTSTQNAVETQGKIATVQKQIESGQGDAKILAVQKTTLENQLKLYNADKATAEKQIGDRMLNLGLAFPKEASAPAASTTPTPPKQTN
jgi:uncharacterized protein YlxW (UPF0749 family)